MLGGPGEAVTAWSRAMVRRCCLPAPGSSRRQTLTPKSCALRVDSAHPAATAARSRCPSSCRRTRRRSQPDRRSALPAGRGGAAAARGNPARNVGDDLAQLAARAANRPHPSPVGRRSSQHPLPGVPGLRPRRAVSAVAALGGDQRSRPGGDRSRRADPRVRQRGQPPPAEIRSRVRAWCAVPARQELIRTRRQRPRR